jgi:ribosomal protein L25 (general stress protein Ctc)
LIIFLEGYSLSKKMTNVDETKMDYKAFDKNLVCSNLQYEICKVYTYHGELKVCKCGLHCFYNPPTGAINIFKEIVGNELDTLLDSGMVDNLGYQKWYKNGQLHRDGDLPAVVSRDGGTYHWYKNGQPHRDGDLPAVVYSDGTHQWYKNGQLHRDGDLPAVVYSDGTHQWYKNGQLHRDGDLPAMIDRDGTHQWYKNDQRHRNGDLPAVVYRDGTREWYKKRYS